MPNMVNPYWGASFTQTAHRYWRIYINDNGGDSSASIQEIEMHESEYGVNVLTGGTSSASSSFSSQYLSGEAVDGSPFDASTGSASAWGSNVAVADEWWQYDLGASNDKAIVSVGIFSRGDGRETQTPIDFDVQYSDDGSSWTTAWSVTGLTWASYGYQKFVNPAYTEPSYTGSPWGSHTTWRVYIRQTTGGGSPAIAEFQMRATPSGADQITGGTASASSEFSASFDADEAWDDSASTFWASTGGEQQWWQYVFGSAVEVAELVMQYRPSSPTDQGPETFMLQYLSSGRWTTTMFVSGESTWSLGETRTFTDPNYI